MQVKILNSEQANQIDRQQWDKLADQSAFTNPFYESWCLLPAFKFLTENLDIRIVCAYKDDELIALFPIELGKRKLGVQYIDIWKHHHCFLTDPLCSQPLELSRIMNRVIRALNMMAVRIRDHSLFSYGRYIDERSVVLKYTRGAILDTKNTQEYLLTLPRKMRLENKRISKRFFNKTKAEYWTSDTHPEIDWLKAFCDLEHAGWKRTVEGSILSHQNTHHYYQAMHDNAKQMGKIKFQGFFNQQGSLAVAFRIISRNQAFDLKTCYNEDYRELYPGVNLEFANMHDLPQYGYDYVDSCTMSENYLINRIWPDQRSLYTSFYFHGGFVSKVLKIIYRFKNRRALKN